MFTAPGVRPVLCLLLVVSTMIGVAAPVRGCACSSTVRAESTTRVASPAVPQVSAAPALKPCCTRSCCAAIRHAESPDCCCEAPPTQSVTQKSASKQSGSDNQDCGAAGCDCGVPEIPPTPPAPTNAASDATDFAHVGSPVPPSFLPTPSTASRTDFGSPHRTPTDLVISLSRLTC